MSRTTSATAIPRFLLPQLTWKSPSLRPPTVAVSKSFQAGARPFHHDTPPRVISSLASARSRYDLSTWKSLSFPPRFVVSPFLPSPSSSTRKPFSTTRRLARDHHFDTLKFVQHLQDEGFSEDQARAVMLVLSEVIEESIQNLTRTMVLREGTTPPPVPPIPPGCHPA